MCVKRVIKIATYSILELLSFQVCGRSILEEDSLVLAILGHHPDCLRVALNGVLPLLLLERLVASILQLHGIVEGLGRVDHLLYAAHDDHLPSTGLLCTWISLFTLRTMVRGGSLLTQGGTVCPLPDHSLSLSNSESFRRRNRRKLPAIV